MNEPTFDHTMSRMLNRAAVEGWSLINITAFGPDKGTAGYGSMSQWRFVQVPDGTDESETISTQKVFP
jgi:hypothetical protein